jgi:hypothetical protein
VPANESIDQRRLSHSRCAFDQQCFERNH